jgi:hypothetical protein
MESWPAYEQAKPMKETPQIHSLRYFISSLAGIARALEDFGYRQEADELLRVKRDLENKILRAKE